VYLPRLIGEVAHSQAKSLATAVSSKGESILLVEDNIDVRTFTAEVLRELGYQVTVAEDGPRALQLLEQMPTVDLLFTDVGLPHGMSGRQVAEQALKLRPTLKVLYTTAYARNSIIHHGRLDPGVDLIAKPYTHANLAGKLREVLDRPPALGRRD
jgi:CheY-like chemotaxis protein